MGRYIKLKQYGMTTYVEGRTQGVRIKVEAEESSGMPLEIFVYQRRPSAPPGESLDVFTNVASPNDLQEYPAGDDPGPDSPFYRRAMVDLVFRSPDHAQQAIDSLILDINQLVESLNYMDTLVLQREIVIGEPPSPSSSSSSSSSLPSSSSP